ncbi:helix-turn-helix domain-containing protein [Pseudomonas aeruginosa]|uniref:helix-turn-helix domain-containing protein n=1 Tax=Pseudomonas aeruginosa TaxID=287 RepID=UPI0006903A1C|nr:S24 family peptidase [Pseudomonas aeruginosa]
MSRDYMIGTAIRNRRMALGWGLQKLIDAAGVDMSTGYLSTIETKDQAPSVYVADALARGLGTTVDTLLREARDPESVSPPGEHAQRVPVLEWEKAAEWAANPDAKRLAANTPWVIPPDTAPGRTFGLVVRDELMQAPTGPSFPLGYTIFVDPTRTEAPGDFIVGHDGDPGALVFKKLHRDGQLWYLRALNPQFPMQQLGDKFKVIGVVVGVKATFDKGGVL